MESKPRYGRGASEVRVQLGASFVLELPAHATGGYMWQLARDPEVAVLREERILPAGPALGAPAVQEFEFLATRPGESRLVMEYKRPWESTLTERLELTVVVASESFGL